MFFALGAASSAIDLLSSLTSSSSTPNGHAGTIPGSSFSITNPITITSASTTSGGSGGSQFSPSTFNTLLAAQSQSSGPTSRSAALSDLFSQIDSNGDGQITKSEFETALGAGGTNLQMADDVFNKMDLNGDGNISKDEMARSLEKSGHHHHHHHAGGAGDGNGAVAANGAGGSGGNADALIQALQGASSTSTINSDGSTTTTLTYADGTKITMTQPAAGTNPTTSANGKASQSYNFTERLIERQAQLISANATQPLSMSV